MIRVAVIIDSLNIGGAQRLISAYATSAPAHGIAPVIITLSKNPSSLVEETIRSAGADVVTMNAPSLFSVRRLRQLIRLLREEKIDIVQTHLIYSNILGSIAAKMAGLPAIPTLHSTHVRPGFKAWILKQLEDFSLRKFSTRILAVGNVVAEVHRGRYPECKVDVIQNGIPESAPIQVQEREHVRHEITGNASVPIIVTVGRFARAKAYEDMIEALSLLRGKDLRPVLLMVGTGGTVNAIKEQIRELDLIQSVVLAGERHDVSRLLASSDVYASSSHREGLPLAVLEAMMAGLPIVATSVGDIPSVVTGDTGTVVPPRQPEQLAAALEDLLRNPEKRQAMGKAAHRRAMSEYSVDAWMEKHVALYRNVLNLHGRRASK